MVRSLEEDCKRAYVINAVLSENVADLVNGNYSKRINAILEGIEGATEILESVLKAAYSAVGGTASRFRNRPVTTDYARCKKLMQDESMTSALNCSGDLNCVYGPQVHTIVEDKEQRSRYYKFIVSVFIEMVKKKHQEKTAAACLDAYLICDNNRKKRYYLSTFEKDYLVPMIVEDGSIKLSDDVLKAFEYLV